MFMRRRHVHNFHATVERRNTTKEPDEVPTKEGSNMVRTGNHHNRGDRVPGIWGAP